MVILGMIYGGLDFFLLRLEVWKGTIFFSVPELFVGWTLNDNNGVMVNNREVYPLVSWEISRGIQLNNELFSNNEFCGNQLSLGNCHLSP